MVIENWDSDINQAQNHPSIDNRVVFKKRKLKILSAKRKRNFARIKNLSRLLSSQFSRHKSSDLYSDEKLKKHQVGCVKLNKGRIKLPSPSNRNVELDNSYKIVRFKNMT